VEPAVSFEWLGADIRDWRKLRIRLSEGGPFDALVDLVTAPFADIGIEDRSRSEFDVNVAGTWTLLSEAFTQGVRRVVYVSTLNVYGELGTRHHREDDDLLKTATADVAEPYGLSKRLAEQLVEYFVMTRSLSGIALRLDSLHVPMIMERRGIHILDLAGAVRLALIRPLEGFQVVNITSDPKRHNVSVEAAHRILGWAPAHPLEFRPELEDWTQTRTPPLPPLSPPS
jgi:nucleoside-diphosphate-sugar epimerase